MGAIGLRVKVHYMEAGRGQVVDVEEFTHRFSSTPDGHLVCSLLFRLVDAAEEGRQDVAVFGVEVVSGPVEIGGHHAAEVGIPLPVEAFAHLDARYLGYGVRFVGRFQGAGEEVLLLHRLGALPGVDAGTAQKEQRPDARPESAGDDVGLDLDVFGDEVGGVGVVGPDAADLCRGQG